ncbi:hypothetical protein QAD02_000264 [Eretmocerus hayati]|uniref:Uncharacterized protein n=1 Tax=Eretmocerus hayati TaxID=131215 RepID=A0ACC2NCW6_9HYME|nr:hypothetical protein QAD02_000264 [Eretmocerus hayati]
MRRALLDSYIHYLLIIYLLYKSLPVRSLSREGTKIIEENDLTSLATFVRRYSSIPLCSGSLVTGILVLTTAHCISKIPIEQVQVFLGGNGIQGDSRYDIASFKKYSDWATENNEIYEDDGINIAVVELSRRVELNAKIGLAMIPIDCRVPNQSLKVTLVGWTKSSLTYVRRAGSVKIKSAEMCISHCNTNLIRARLREGKLFCTLPRPHLLAVDEGGPVLYNKRVLVGINFWNEKSRAQDVKNLHINYLYYKNFVQDMICDRQSDQWEVFR